MHPNQKAVKVAHETIYPIPPDARNADDGHHDSPSKIPAQAHAFTLAAVQLRELLFPKAAILHILKNSDAVKEFIEATTALRVNDIDESVFVDIVKNAYGEEI